MITRDDAISAIGFDGNAALCDRSVRTLCRGKSAVELAEAGYFRAAAAAAYHEGNQADLEAVAAIYSRAAGSTYPAQALGRLFGVAKVTVARAIAL